MSLQLTVDEKDARILFLVLLAFELLLVGLYGLSLAEPFHRLSGLFDLDAEGNIPAWFSSLQLFIVGLLLVLSTRRAEAGFPSNRFLLLAGLVFVFLSLDEGVGLHERISTAIGRPDWLPSFRGKRGYWIPIYVAILGGLLASARQSLTVCWALFRRETTWMLVGMVVFLIGAVGMEAFAYEFLLENRVPVNLGVYRLEVIVEEFLEMAGVSLMLYASTLFILRGPGDRI